MNADLEVGRIHEQRFQVFDVLRDAERLVAIGPRNDDVLCVRLAEAIPLLVAEYVEVESVKGLQALLDLGRLLLRGRRRRIGR